MSETDLKGKALQAAMRLMQNKRIQQAMENPKLQQVFSSTVDRGVRLQRELRDLKRHFAEQLDLATEDDLESMKMELQRLRREIQQKREQQASDASS